MLRRISGSESASGAIMLGAALLALFVANTDLQSQYEQFRSWTFAGMDLRHWVQDGLLAIFFMVAGLELKHELTQGTLRSPRKAAVPIVAALGGMAIPAALYLLISPTAQGWPIPMATDIAFALAVLAVFGRGLPTALRAFLLTLAIVDDVVAILIIALVFTKSINPVWLIAFIALAAVYYLSQQKQLDYLAIPLGVAAWYSLHESGIHATVAGVVLGLLTRDVHKVDDVLRPMSSAIILPIFAFVTAGIVLADGFLTNLFQDQTSTGIIVGLVVGKIVGITGFAYLLVKFTHAQLDSQLKWGDVFAASSVAGIGFTVALLLASLSFDQGSDAAIAAVLFASLISTLLAALLLTWRRRVSHTLR